MNNENMNMLPIIQEVFEKKIAFNQVLGLKVESFDHDSPKISFEMREELVGNYQRGMLHGGVISTVIDVTGGLVAFMGVQQRMGDVPIKEKLEVFGCLSTIDLRVDYLRPGFGARFIATGSLLRIGKKVAVTRIELHNEKDNLIAVGTGAYVIA
ncbi:MAG: thioesterase family protein [Desulfuromonadales bacterium]|nr:thioesterase family protein [Desulfuromonadales bacterium]